jgi:hypothetical protein
MPRLRDGRQRVFEQTGQERRALREGDERSTFARRLPPDVVA